jgi:hypothetical protein
MRGFAPRVRLVRPHERGFRGMEPTMSFITTADGTELY